MKVFLFVLLTIFFETLISQIDLTEDSLSLDILYEDSMSQEEAKVPGEVIEYVDSIYYATEALQKKINFTQCPKIKNGYRIQVYSCSGEDCKLKANKYYSQFLIAFPNISVNRIWQPPAIKVRAGDCRTRFEAQKIRNQVKDLFPSVFIVEDRIKLPYETDCSDMKISKSDSLLILPLRN